MEFCAGCGHRLSVGRFCTNCGRPIAAPEPQDETVQRPEMPVPSSPPPAYTPPPAVRYPLFSDELQIVQPTAPPPPTPTTPPPTYQPTPAPARTSSGGPSFLAVAMIVVILMLVAVIGGLLLFAGGDEDRADDATPGDAPAQSESPPPSPDPGSTKGPTKAPPTDGVQDLASYATAAAPSTAKPNQDTSGNMVRYDARNMVDGVPSTCWRTPGDGTGLELTFTFPQPVELSEVGLINGYAKSSGALDWYVGNRRVLAATWVFDDGTEVPHSLTETRQLQSIAVGPITTTTVVLRLDSVSPPGRGPSARNNTAVSDVSLVGAAA